MLGGEQGFAGTYRHEDLTERKRARLLQLTVEELDACLDQGKAVQVRMRVPGGSGPVVGVQDRTIDGQTRLIFG